MAYELNTGAAYGRVDNFSRIPRVMRDADGLYVNVEATIYDYRNYGGDDKAMSVMLNLWGLWGKKSGRTKQDVHGDLLLVKLRERTGLRPETVVDKLRALADRGMIRLDVQERGKKTAYRVALRLPLSDWKIPHLHLPDTD